LIGPGDLIEVTVFDEPQLTQRLRVEEAGEIHLAMLGAVKVGGLSPNAAASLIGGQYRTARLLNNPRVSVLVLEYATQSTAVLGQVAHPGAILLYAPRSILEVLSMAGGLTEIADRHVTIQHRNGVTDMVFLPNASDVMVEQAAVMVNPGDTVLVPKAGIVYVLGDVARPGGYVMQNDSRMTLLQAISAASGVNRTADEKHARLIRSLENGNYQELEVPLRSIEKGKDADIALKANDVLYIPFSMKRHIVLGAPAILSTTSAAAIYAHP
jgi:polysaccharide export outer membrane protein